MDPVSMPEKLKSETDHLFSADGEGSGKKRQKGLKEVRSSENREVFVESDSKIDGSGGNLTSDLSRLSSESPSSSSESVASPVGTFVSGGKVRRQEVSRSVNLLSHGFVSVIGRSRVMEDAVTVAPAVVGGEFSFFAVYNSHGHGGSKVANDCSGQLHRLLEKEIEGEMEPDDLRDGGVIDWRKVISACFAKMDEEARCCDGDFSVGSTALVVVVGKKELVVANCGDSRVVLCRDGVAMPLSLDHKPNRPDERERMEAAGGRIINWKNFRVQGVPTTSRSIASATTEPEVTVIKRTESDEFLIIASNGLWEVLSNYIACEVARTCFDCPVRTDGTSSALAATMLARLAMAKGSKDNISVIVVELNHNSS